MFKADSLCVSNVFTVIDRDMGVDVFLNGRKATRLALSEVVFNAEAVRLIGAGILTLSRDFGLPVPIIKKAMAGNLFIVPPSESLYFLFQIDELEADMHVEIPPMYWRFAAPVRTVSELAKCA
ncbi:hypothetical protein [Desulfolutivibrio sulfoxidireducens]|uniref:hypothetical protein n=1 Tax=Desulfolutivibrio sulfoxidireducens TaxID=2773299 RepID=UPI00210EA5BC|nr:hypothetical protein [Desulfolutivibrio sulfoxidireducens]